MPTSRRQFLISTAGALAASAAASVSPAAAMQPFVRSNKPSASKISLSCAAHCYRKELQDKNNPLTLADFIELAAGFGCDAVELTSYYMPESPTREYLLDLRRRVLLLGMTVSGLPIRTDYCVPAGPEREKQVAFTRKWIDAAATLGAPTIRVFAGGDPKKDLEQQRTWCVETISECLQYAAEAGIFLAMENHAGIVQSAELILPLIKGIDSPWFGVNLDTGNFHSPDPYADLEAVAPYAVVVQVKTDVFDTKDQKVEADLPRQIKTLRKAGFRGFAALEYEGKDAAPQAVPKYLVILRKLIDETA